MRRGGDPGEGCSRPEGLQNESMRDTMAYMGDDDTGGIVRDLQLKVEFLDGWRVGESERYDRLERDLGRVADEVALLRQETRAEFGSIRVEFGSIHSEFGGIRMEFGNVYGEFGRVRQEIAGLRAEFSGLRTEFDNMRRDLMGLSTRTHTELRLMMVLMLSGMFMLWLNTSG